MVGFCSILYANKQNLHMLISMVRKMSKIACQWLKFLLDFPTSLQWNSGSVFLFYYLVALKKADFKCVVAQYLMGQPLDLITCRQRFGIEWTSLTRWSWVTTRFQEAMSDSISSRLLVGCLLDISEATLCQRFSISIGLRSGDWAGQPSVVMLFRRFHSVTFFARWQGDRKSVV